MKHFLIVTVFLAMTVIVCSCGKSTCLNPTLRVTFKGFDTSELSTVVVEQYTMNTGFATLINIGYYDTATIQIRQSTDTVYFPKVDTAGISIAPGYDYRISVLATGSSYTISKIAYSQVKHAATNRGGCTNDVTYYLDSLPHKISGAAYAESHLPPVKVVLNK